MSPLDLIYAVSKGISLIGITKNDLNYVDGQKYSRLEFMIHDFFHADMNSRYSLGTEYLFEKILEKVDLSRIALAFILLHERQNSAVDFYKMISSGQKIPPKSISSLYGLANRLDNKDDLASLMSGVTDNSVTFLHQLDDLFYKIFAN